MSLQVSNNCFIGSQLKLKLGQFDEATELLKKAILSINNLIENPSQYQGRKIEELIIIKIKYVTAMASSLYIGGKNYLESAQNAEIALQDYKKLPVELEALEEIAQLRKELESIKVRAEAKIQSKSAIELR